VLAQGKPCEARLEARLGRDCIEIAGEGRTVIGVHDDGGGRGELKLIKGCE